MVLDSLFELMDELNSRIHRYSTALQKSEALTRNVLIDPLLRKLGWDTENPEKVRPEYRSGSGSADYALLKNGKPIMMIEAKKLDTSLRDGLVQGINYSLVEGTRYFAVTDGRRWEIYEPHKEAPISEKLIVSFDVGDPTPSNAVFSALALLYQNATGPRLTSARSPLSDQTTEMEKTPAIPAAIDTSNDAASSDWLRLSDVVPKYHAPAPKFLRFPDKTQVPIGQWVNLPLAVVKWLSGNGALTTKDCPIQYAKRYIVSTNPSHPNGSQFRMDRPIGQFHVEVNYSGPDQLRNTLIIMKHVAQDVSLYTVLF